MAVFLQREGEFEHQSRGRKSLVHGVGHSVAADQCVGSWEWAGEGVEVGGGGSGSV